MTVLKGLSIRAGAAAVRLGAPAVRSAALSPLADERSSEPAAPHLVIGEAELQARLAAAREEGASAATEAALAAARDAAEAQVARRLERIAKEQAEKMRQLALALAAQMGDVRDRFEADVAEAVFIATGRLLGEAAFTAAQVAQHVRRVLVEAGMPEEARVLLHADDLHAVQAAQTHSPHDWPVGIRFAAAPEVAVGGCVIETGEQHFDARLEVQLAMLHERLGLARARRDGSEGDA